MSSYQSKPFWFYNQPAAFTKAPGVQMKNKRVDADVTNIPFICPADTLLPSGERAVQLDDGLFVGCRELEPMYTGKDALDDISSV